jgi:hypothetical protein
MQLGIFFIDANFKCIFLLKFYMLFCCNTLFPVEKYFKSDDPSQRPISLSYSRFLNAKVCSQILIPYICGN